jgi:hypothetical protein
VDVTEYMFKLALLERKYELVISMIKGSALCGQSIISYLQVRQQREQRRRRQRRRASCSSCRSLRRLTCGS